MKNRNLSPNAREAFHKFKEELAQDMDFNMHKRDDHTTRAMNKESDSKYTHLGRS